jgi:hypothetical protein
MTVGTGSQSTPEGPLMTDYGELATGAAAAAIVRNA